MSVDTAPILSIFRVVAPEFKPVEDDKVKGWIALTAPLVSRRRFTNLHDQALALLTAHRMKMVQVNVNPADDPLAVIGNIGLGNFMRVGSYSEGKTSISFNHNIAQYTATDAELGLTEYGIQFLTLRRKRIVPIVNAGEWRWR